MTDLSYARYVLEHNKKQCDIIKKQLKTKGFNPHGINKSIWRKAIKNKC